jgi:hypothetical protein
MTPYAPSGQVFPRPDDPRPGHRVPPPDSAAVPAALSTVLAAIPAEVTQLPPHTQAPLTCRRCSVVAVPVVTPGTGQHAYRADCSSCGAYIKFISPYSPEERARRRQQVAMERLAPTEPQLAYLKALGAVQPPPATRAQASQRIAHLLRQRKGVA